LQSIYMSKNKAVKHYSMNLILQLPLVINPFHSELKRIGGVRAGGVV
jgi:hypothetical protein